VSLKGFPESPDLPHPEVELDEFETAPDVGVAIDLVLEIKRLLSTIKFIQ